MVQAHFPASTFKIFPQKNFLKKPALKKFLIFSQKKAFLIFSQKSPPHFLVQARKYKKIHSEKNLLYFRKYNFLALILKKIQETEPPPQIFLTFQETESLKKLLMHQEMKLLSPPQEYFLYFRKQKPRKNFLCFLKRKLFFYFQKQKPQNGNSKKLLIFQEVTCKAQKINKKVFFEEIACLV